MLRKLCFLIAVLLVFSVKAQELLPFVENFTKSDYNGDNQVWDVEQGYDNSLYFANHHYMLRYNGIKWDKFTLPNKTVIRSVCAEGNRLYCGSYKEFGYWETKEAKTVYVSLSKGKELFNGNADNEEIWKIFRYKEAIYFQAFNILFRYKDQRIEKIAFPSQVSYCYPVESHLYAATVRNGVYELKGNLFIPVKNWPQLKETVVHGIEKCGNDTFIFTKNHGIFKTKANGLEFWDNPVNQSLKNNVILTARVVNNHIMAIGTALNGLYIVDVHNNTVKNINKSNGLRNNAVLSVTVDRESNLWLGLDNGIAHVEINSPVSLFTDNSGILGSVYALSPYKNGYLLATNHGLFSYQDKLLKAVPNSQGQVWDIYQNDEKYIIGHNDGTFLFKDNVLNRANPVNGGWNFVRSLYDEIYFQPNYSGIVVYNDVNNLGLWQVLGGLTKPIRHIAQTRPGELWAADTHRGLYRITYDKDFSVRRVENVSEKNGITSDFGIKMFHYRNELLFYINNRWYSYNSLNEKLEKNTLFDKEFNSIDDVIAVDDEVFIIVEENRLYVITQNGKAFNHKLIPEKYYQGRLIADNIEVLRSNNTLFINLDDGFMTYNFDKKDIKDLNVTLEAIYNGQIVSGNFKADHNQPIEINVLSGYYGFDTPALYYRLNNNGDYTPANKGSFTLNNLESGTQLVDVYFYDGNKYLKVKTYEFFVKQPWYFSFYMVVAYVAALACIFFLYYRWNNLRYKQKVRFHEEELKHKAQILELEMEAENKLRREQHEKHMLEAEVQNKASEVAGKSLSIAKHSEMIEHIQEALSEEANLEALKTKIKKIIKASTLSKNEWQSFERNLLKSHEDFVARLTKRFPELTPKDIKLAIYLKMNLSSKEIAPLMNISYRGVELHRYRLRKKLNINTEDSLNSFMITL
jgi:AraC family transcriptional regulator, chitin signaling transcriptional activator